MVGRKAAEKQTKALLEASERLGRGKGERERERDA